MSVVELADPFRNNHGSVGAGYVEVGGSPDIGFVSLRAVGVEDLIVFNAALQRLDLGVESRGFPIMGFLGLTDSANSSAQDSPESDGIQVGNVSKQGVQGAGGDRDEGRGWRDEDGSIILATRVGGFLGGHGGGVDLVGRIEEGRKMRLIVAIDFLLSLRGFDR